MRRVYSSVGTRRGAALNVATRRKLATKLRAGAWLGERRHDRRRLAPASRRASAAGVRKIVWACLAGPWPLRVHHADQAIRSGADTLDGLLRKAAANLSLLLSTYKSPASRQPRRYAASQQGRSDGDSRRVHTASRWARSPGTADARQRRGCAALLLRGPCTLSSSWWRCIARVLLPRSDRSKQQQTSGSE